MWIVGGDSAQQQEEQFHGGALNRQRCRCLTVTRGDRVAGAQNCPGVIGVGGAQSQAGAFVEWCLESWSLLDDLEKLRQPIGGDLGGDAHLAVEGE
jgi:hypothetical protein